MRWLCGWYIPPYDIPTNRTWLSVLNKYNYTEIKNINQFNNRIMKEKLNVLMIVYIVLALAGISIRITGGGLELEYKTLAETPAPIVQFVFRRIIGEFITMIGGIGFVVSFLGRLWLEYK